MLTLAPSPAIFILAHSATLALIQTAPNSELPPEIIALRTACFRGLTPETAYDAFDPRSTQLCVWLSQQLIGCCRVTIGKPSVFESWSRGALSIHHERSGELSRFAVDPTFRGQGIFELLVLNAALLAQQLGALHAISAVPHLSGFLVGLGFFALSDRMTFQSAPDRVIEDIPIACPLQPLTSRWDDLFSKVLTKITSQPKAT